MRTSTLFAGGIAAWILCVPFAGQAQTTQEGADKIRLGLKEWIASHLTTADKSVVFNFQGPITVVPQGKSYKAVIPKSEVVFADGDDPVTLPVDTVELVLTPQENGWLDTTITIPSHYRPESKDGKGIDVTIGSQALHGLFAPQYQTFMALDSKLGGIEARSLDPAEAKGSLKVGEIAINGDSKAVGQDTYDSTATVTISDSAFVDEKGAQLFKLDEASVAGTATAANLVALYAFSQKLEALQKRYPNASDGEPSKEFLGELSKVFGGTPNLFDNFGFTYGLKGLTVTPPPAAGEPEQVTVASTSFGIGISGLAKDASTFQVTLDLDKLGIVPNPEFGQFVPHTATVDLALTNLPNKVLLQALTSMLDSSATLGPDQAAEIAAGQLQQALLNSNGALEIRSFKAVSPLTSIDLTGTLKPNPRAPLMMTGEVKLVVVGMEDALEAAKTMPDGQEAVQGLTMLQTLGAQDTVDGKPARTYQLVVSEKGDILLNGTDLKPLLGLR
jgi:hypothetical protein